MFVRFLLTGIPQPGLERSQYATEMSSINGFYNIRSMCTNVFVFYSLPLVLFYEYIATSLYVPRICRCWCSKEMKKQCTLRRTYSLRQQHGWPRHILGTAIKASTTTTIHIWYVYICYCLPFVLVHLNIVLDVADADLGL